MKQDVDLKQDRKNAFKMLGIMTKDQTLLNVDGLLHTESTLMTGTLST